MIASRAQRVERLRAALQIANETGNTRLASTINEMLRTESARSVRSTSGIDMNADPRRTITRALYNPRKAAKKLKLELYDTRIDLDSPSAIAAKKAAYDQKCKVFRRAN